MLFDFICLIIIVAGFVLGYRRGIIAQVSSIFGVLAGIICCNIFGGSVADHFIESDDNVETVILVNMLTYVLIFMACYLIGRLIGSFCTGIFKSLSLGALNKLGGALFTMFEYTLVFSLVLNAFFGAFPSAELKTDHKGVKEFVINMGPKVLGSSTITGIYDSLRNGIEKGGCTFIDSDSTGESDIPITDNKSDKK